MFVSLFPISRSRYVRYHPLSAQDWFMATKQIPPMCTATIDKKKSLTVSEIAYPRRRRKPQGSLCFLCIPVSNPRGRDSYMRHLHASYKGGFLVRRFGGVSCSRLLAKCIRNPMFPLIFGCSSVFSSPQVCRKCRLALPIL